MEIQDELMQVAQADVQKADLPAGPLEMTEWIFANEKNPALIQMFHSLYDGAFKNRLGVAHCKDVTSGKLATLLVGIGIDGTNVQMFPLARILDEAEVNNYLAPDGNGGFLGETAEA